MDYSKLTDEQLEGCQRDEVNAIRGANIVRANIRMWNAGLGFVGLILVVASLHSTTTGEVFDILFFVGCYVVFKCSGPKSYPASYPFIDKNDPEWREKIIKRLKKLDDAERVHGGSSYDDSM